MAIALYILPAMKIVNQPILYLACIVVQMTMAMGYIALFTVMMDKSELNTAGTDYTLQASFSTLSTIIASGIAGFIAETFGYVFLFVIAIAIGLANVVLIARTFNVKAH